MSKIGSTLDEMSDEDLDAYGLRALKEVSEEDSDTAFEVMMLKREFRQFTAEERASRVEFEAKVLTRLRNLESGWTKVEHDKAEE